MNEEGSEHSSYLDTVLCDGYLYLIMSLKHVVRRRSFRSPTFLATLASRAFHVKNFLYAWTLKIKL